MIQTRVFTPLLLMAALGIGTMSFAQSQGSAPTRGNPVITTEVGSNQYRYKFEDFEFLKNPGTLLLRLFIENDRVVAGSVVQVRHFDQSQNQLWLEPDAHYHLTSDDLEDLKKGQFVYGNNRDASSPESNQQMSRPGVFGSGSGQVGLDAGVNGIGQSVGRGTEKGIQKSAAAFQFSLEQFEILKIQQERELEAHIGKLRPLMVIRTDQKLMNADRFQSDLTRQSFGSSYAILSERHPQVRTRIQRLSSPNMDQFVFTVCRSSPQFCQWMVSSQMAFQDFLFSADDIALPSFLPWAGTAINIYEVATGQSFVEARPLTEEEYALRVASLLIGYRTSLGWTPMKPEWKEVLLDVTWEITAWSLEFGWDQDRLRQELLKSKAFEIDLKRQKESEREL